MRKLLIIVMLTLILGTLAAAPAAAQSVSVTCDNGASFDNGVEIVINQMRTGFTYTATAIGLNGFDPVLAVLGEDRTGLCTDDDSFAAGYSANLPTTGSVAASGLSSQVRFSNNGSSAFADISLVVGGLNNTSGEFLLILEGMGVTEGDGAGDPFSVIVTPDMVGTGVPLTVYMVSRGQVDPYMAWASPTFDAYLTDMSGNAVYCDDSGNPSLCYGTSYDLTGSFVSSDTGRLGGNQLDAMITFPLADMTWTGDPAQDKIDLLFTSYQYNTLGQYVVAFHGAVAAPGSTGTDGKNTASTPNTQQQQQQQQPPVNNTSVPVGVTVTCDNGASFDNGVEVVINQMRTGFNYTATAIGINGFDPVLAVLGENRTGLCTDDDAVAARYDASLPSSGNVSASNFSSQVRFSNNGNSAFADISLVVGGYGNTNGEFLLVLEGMALTSGDGYGDWFSVNLTPGMVESGVPMTIYMISRVNSLDPYMGLLDPSNIENFFVDSAGLQVTCDDAGSSSCYGTSSSLSGSFITTERGNLGGFQYDSMLTLPLAGLQLAPDANQNWMNFLFTSFQGDSLGEYVVVFHIGTSGSAGFDADA